MPQIAVETLPVDFLVGPNGQPLDRGNRYGEQYVQPMSLDRLADEGSLFLTKNATKGTGVTVTNNITQDTTKPFFFASLPITAKRAMRLHRFYIRMVGIGSGWATINIDFITSVGATVSGGTDYLALASGLTGVAGYRGARSGVPILSQLDRLVFGVPTAVLGTNARQVASITPRPGTIPVAGDEYIINFGSMFSDVSRIDLTTYPAGTTVNRYVKQDVPIIVDPGSSVMAVMWAAAMAGTVSIEFEPVWSER